MLETRLDLFFQVVVASMSLTRWALNTMPSWRLWNNSRSPLPSQVRPEYTIWIPGTQNLDSPEHGLSMSGIQITISQLSGNWSSIQMSSAYWTIQRLDSLKPFECLVFRLWQLFYMRHCLHIKAALLNLSFNNFYTFYATQFCPSAFAPKTLVL